ncbi:Calpain-6 [Nowakowskiella sp. JEL0407]|nr:Calpain-6 [Nowakowskiella sp. JEL0407]
MHPNLVNRVIPQVKKQDYVHVHRDSVRRGGVYRGFHLTPKIHPGIFRFRFYRFGEWVEVVVDDFLPCGPDGQPLFARSRNPDEFWVSLLEKAYAKLNGCYESLEAGSSENAFVDLSGSIPERIDITQFGVYNKGLESEDIESKRTKSILNLVLRAFKQRSLMSASIVGSKLVDVRDKAEILKTGLMLDRSYAITAIMEVRGRTAGLRRKTLQLIKFRIPCEYFNDQIFTAWNEEWISLTKRELKRLGLDRETLENAGEFCMSFKDFAAKFTTLTICHQVDLPQKLFGSVSPWKSWEFYSRWSRDERTAGGSINNPLFSENPQFIIDLRKGGSLMICLMQRDRREEWTIQCRRHQAEIERNEQPVSERGVINYMEYLFPFLFGTTNKQNRGSASEKGQKYVVPKPKMQSIGLVLLRVEQNREFRIHNPTHIQYPVAGSIPYSRTRDVFGRFDNLDAGRYVLFPTTFEAGSEGDFFLRVFASSTSNASTIMLDSSEDNKGSGIRFQSAVKPSSKNRATLLKTNATRLKEYQRTIKNGRVVVGKQPVVVARAQSRKATKGSISVRPLLKDSPSVQAGFWKKIVSDKPQPNGVFRVSLLEYQDISIIASDDEENKKGKGKVECEERTQSSESSGLYCLVKYFESIDGYKPSAITETVISSAANNLTNETATLHNIPKNSTDKNASDPSPLKSHWLRESRMFERINVDPVAYIPSLRLRESVEEICLARIRTNSSNSNDAVTEFPQRLCRYQFNSSFMWIAKQPESGWVRFEVWEKRLLRDEFIGVGILEIEEFAADNFEGKTWDVEIDLNPRKIDVRCQPKSHLAPKGDGEKSKESTSESSRTLTEERMGNFSSHFTYITPSLSQISNDVENTNKGRVELEGGEVCHPKETKRLLKLKVRFEKGLESL